MSNKSISDYVAASMDAVLKSSEHKTLFGKFASDNNCAKDHDHDSSCSSESMAADDNDARRKAKKDSSSSSSSSSSSDSNDALNPHYEIEDDDSPELSFEEQFPEASEYLSLHFPDAAKMLEVHDLEGKYPRTSHVLTEDLLPEPEVRAGFDIAIDSLLTASAALDSLGMEKTATLSLKLASIIVEAKKKDTSSSSSSSKEKAAKEKEKAAKEKAKEKAAKEKAKAKEKAAKEKAAKEKAKSKSSSSSSSSSSKK